MENKYGFNKCQICNKKFSHCVQIWDEEGEDLLGGIVVCYEHAEMIKRMLDALTRPEEVK